MESSKIETLSLRDGGIFVHDESDLADYDSFFEFVLGNGEMMGRVDALHSQHLRHGAKKDALCVRLVDLWGERTYPVHRGRPGGRFLSRLEDREGNAVELADVGRYNQVLDPKRGVLQTAYGWARGESTGENRSLGFMSKVRKHVMTLKYVDKVNTIGWARTFAVETIFPYHSRASAFYFKKPYNPKKWAWGEVEHENEIEPVNNAEVTYDPAKNLGIVTFHTEFPGLRTEVVWVLRPIPEPDSWDIDGERGGLIFRWDLKPEVSHEAAVIAAVMTDRDDTGYRRVAEDEALGASALGWSGLEKEHVEWWRNELGKSRVTLPDAQLQKLYDVSMHYLLNNVGGSYWGFIGVDNVIYETCMCDNMITLHALVETNHLEEAKRELELLDKYLPAAKKNAADRMKVVGISSSDSALLPFYMTEDGIELWQDNVFGMYASMSAFHFLALLKTSLYLADEDFLRTRAYPWFKAYAEYGRLTAVWDEGLGAYVYPIENAGGGGEGYWFWVTMSKKLYTRIFAQSTSMFRFADFPPIEFFPKEEISRLSSNWIDTVVNFNWILGQTARFAEGFDSDEELREQWKKVAAGLHMPQNDRFFLSNMGPDAAPSVGGSAVGTFFWPAEGTFENLAGDKVERTFREISGQRFLKSKNRAWDAVYGFSFAYLNMGEEAYRCLKSFGQAADHRGIEMREGIHRQNYYYLLNHGSLVLLTRYMLLQSYKKKIRVFPAVPPSWKSEGVEFAHLPAEGGLSINGKTNAESSEVEISDRRGVRIVRFEGGFTFLEITPTGLDKPGGERQFDLEAARGRVEVTLFDVEMGRRYRIETGGKERVMEAAADLRFSVTSPGSVRITPA
jgi:hypothetical protein